MKNNIFMIKIKKINIPKGDKLTQIDENISKDLNKINFTREESNSPKKIIMFNEDLHLKKPEKEIKFEHYFSFYDTMAMSLVVKGNLKSNFRDK